MHLVTVCCTTDSMGFANFIINFQWMSLNFQWMNLGKNYTTFEQLSIIISFEALLEFLVSQLSCNTDICRIFHWLHNCLRLVGEPAGSKVHPLHGVSWADWADPQGDRSVIASTQGRLCLLLSDWLGHFHTTCRYPTFQSQALYFTLKAV